LEINTSDVATGTGFLFSSSDYVITSYHVVHGAKSIKVRLVNGERIDATVALKDTNNDIAVLKLSQSPTSRQNIIVLGDSSSVKTGDRVFTYGFPLVDLLGDAEPRYSEGFINSLSGISNDPRLFQVSILFIQVQLDKKSVISKNVVKNHLNFTLPDISSTYIGGIFGHCMLPGRYKQSERKKALNQGVNASHSASQGQKWATV
jgi:hypothetical protein